MVAAALRIGLIGDRDDTVTAHRAIPIALDLAAKAIGRPVQPNWLPTESIGDGAGLADFAGLWCVPASPYRSMDGALTAIRWAREHDLPFLGTCGGFQHAVIETARNVLGWHDAEHAETAPDAARPVISLLECALVEAEEVLTVVPGTLLAQAYVSATFAESYRCRFGLNPAFARELLAGPARAAATGPTGDVHALEWPSHRFFVATLFQPERAALAGRLPTLVEAFVRAAAG